MNFSPEIVVNFMSKFAKFTQISSLKFMAQRDKYCSPKEITINELTSSYQNIIHL